MKKRNLYKTLLVLALTIVSLTASGQIYIKNAYSDGLITRSDDAGNHRMHYTKTGPTTGNFLFNLTPSGNDFQFSSYPVSGYNINDFTIFNDTVYVCGEDENGIGFYGWSGDTGTVWTFHIYKLYSSPSTFVTKVNRIRVFRSGPNLNVLLIGVYKPGNGLSYGSIIHAKDNTVCTLAYQNDDFFDDVAILDDYVVTIERKGGKDYGHQMRVLNKTPFSLSDTLFNNYYAWGQIQSIGRMLLQATDSNRLVSVYRNGAGLYFNVFSVNGSGTLLLHNYHTIVPGVMPDIGDVAYNGYSKTLAILHNINTGGTASLFDCTLFPNITPSSSIHPDFAGTELLSVTKLPSSSDFVISGVQQNQTVFWNTTSSNCRININIPDTSASADMDNYLWPVMRTTMEMVYQTYKAPVTDYDVRINCP